MGGPQRSAGGVAASARLGAARIDNTGCPTPATADGPTRLTPCLGFPPLNAIRSW